MSDSFDITTVIFALLALFVLFKLKTVLGARTGNERPPYDPFARQKREDIAPQPNSEGGNVVRLPGSASQSGVKESTEPAANRWERYGDQKAWPGLNDIQKADSGFQAQSFVDGAKAAYEVIISAFASGDKKTLRDLLANDVYEGFASAIAARESRGEKIETSFVSMEKTMIDDAQLRGNVAQVTVRFVSKLITVTRDRTNNVVDGNPDKVVDITDVWTFSRDAKSRDPNWKLIATETGH
jgi:predicted lipid-binding transport protein (Tim44 family)